MTASLVFTVIPNWNLKHDLSECLDSLRSATYPAHKIVVVDNGSTDGSLELVRERYPDVHLIALPENRGYAGALNVGIEYALAQGAQFVFALNNDTVVPPQTLSRLVDVAETDRTIGVATPKIFYHATPERLFGLGDRQYSFWPLPVAIGYKQHDRPRFSGVMDFDYVTGCAMLIQAEVFRQIGLFDISYFMYYEDSDFCRRIRDGNYRIVCVGDAILYHKAAFSTRKGKVLLIRIRARNRVRFYRRYRHGPHPWITYFALGIVAIFKSATYILKKQTDLVAAYIQGLYEGWREPLPPPRFIWEEKNKT
jgi:GT2 family glycosyltransferase